MASSSYSRHSRQDHACVAFSADIFLARLMGTWSGVSCEVEHIDFFLCSYCYRVKSVPSESVGVLHRPFQNQKFTHLPETPNASVTVDFDCCCHLEGNIFTVFR